MWFKELTHWKRPWCWERLKVGGEGDNRGWDGMASPTQWTWVWVSSGSWWWTGRSAVHGVSESDATEWLNWAEHHMRSPSESASESCSVALCDPMDYTYSAGDSPGQNTGVGNFPFSRRSSQPRDQTHISHIAGGFFISWATGKPKNTGVGSLSLPQPIFLTQESNQGLLYCRGTLHQLREALGSPRKSFISLPFLSFLPFLLSSFPPSSTLS